jgi:DNA-binding MarR family transcriptional regulator
MALYRELADYTGYLIRRAQQVHAAVWLREVGSDITSVQFGVLNVLALHPDSDQRTVGDHLGLDRSTIADLVARLEKRGYLRRVRDASDRRRNLLRLSEQGRAELDQLLPAALRVNEHLTARMSGAEHAELRRLLGLLLTAD